METALNDFVARKKGIYGFLHIVVLLLSLLLVIVISVDTFKDIPFYSQPSFMALQLWICIMFLIDFFIEWALADNKRRYFLTHLVFLLVSIPYHNILSFLGYDLTGDGVYILRFMPLIRGGYALAIVIDWFTFNRATGLFITYLATLFSMIYFGSLAFYVTEHAHNPLVTDFKDALWWAFMDVTTVGSNIIAVTPTGRILSVVLAALGMMMFPIFTVYVTNLIEKRNNERKKYYKE